MSSGGRLIAAITLSSALALGLVAVGSAPAGAVAPQPTPADCTIFVVDGTATGTPGDDVICGTDGNDIIVGLGGSDTIFGFGGDDYIDAGAGADWISGGYGADEIVLGSGDDYAMGGPGADRLWGDSGADVLVGYTGDDSLVGGTGADTLDGGSGVDYCRKDSGDIEKSCYFDAAAPTLVSIAVGTPSISTTYASRVAAVRLRVADLGTGVASIEMTFTRRLTNGQFVNPVVFRAETDGADQLCTPDGHAPTPAPDGGSVCLVAGTPTSGVYELRTWVPHWAPQGTYRLSNVVLRDAAGNQARGLDFDSLITRHLAVNFKQVGPGDALAPLVRALEPVTPSVSTYFSERVVGVRLHVTDATSGLAGISLGLARTVRDGGGSVIDYLWPQPQMYMQADGAPLCGTGVPTPAEIMGATSYCRESGTAHDGWYRLWTTLPRWTPKGVYDVVSVDASDNAGNQKFMPVGELAVRGLSTGISQAGPGDDAAPTVSGVAVSTPTVSTGSAQATVTVQVRAADAVSGLGGIFLDLAPVSNPTNVGLSLAAGMEPCSAQITESCLKSGTLSNGLWTLSAVLPAHSPAGVWKLWRISVYDRAGNDHEWDGASFKASFTNS
jgi:hypothetical protein